MTMTHSTTKTTQGTLFKTLLNETRNLDFKQTVAQGWILQNVDEIKKNKNKNAEESARKSPKCLAQPWTERELHG